VCERERQREVIKCVSEGISVSVFRCASRETTIERKGELLWCVSVFECERKVCIMVFFICEKEFVCVGVTECMCLFKGVCDTDCVCVCMCV
jgi:hypothetical protein